MSSRTRTFTTGTSTHSYDQETFDIDAFSDDDLEQMLFQDDEKEKKNPYVNLPTIAGLSMVLVGILYVLQEIGLALGPNVFGLVQLLPIIGGVLILALGFGLIRTGPKKKKIVRSERKTATQSFSSPASGTRSTPYEAGRVVQDRVKPRLKKSRNRKIFGVAGGIAEHFGWDPTWVRVAFVLGALVSQGIAIPLYLAMAFFLPKPDAMTLEERIRVIRDS